MDEEAALRSPGGEESGLKPEGPLRGDRTTGELDDAVDTWARGAGPLMPTLDDGVMDDRFTFALRTVARLGAGEEALTRAVGCTFRGEWAPSLLFDRSIRPMT